MHAIWQSFEDIKEESGISDLDEIADHFIKHEEQNHLIFEYINKLNKEIEELKDQTEFIQSKITEQKKINENYSK